MIKFRTMKKVTLRQGKLLREIFSHANVRLGQKVRMLDGQDFIVIHIGDAQEESRAGGTQLLGLKGEYL